MISSAVFPLKHVSSSPDVVALQFMTLPNMNAAYDATSADLKDHSAWAVPLFKGNQKKGK